MGAPFIKAILNLKSQILNLNPKSKGKSNFTLVPSGHSRRQGRKEYQKAGIMILPFIGLVSFASFAALREKSGFRA